MGRCLRAAGGVLLVVFAGCLGDELNGARYRGKPVDVPAVSDASVATAARVDQVGRQLIAQNPFLGIEPTFRTLGQKEPEIGHVDPHGVFITEGLVTRCKTDAELAAVLASELGKMTAEQRTTDRMQLPDPLRPVTAAGNLSWGGESSDQSQLGTQAIFDKQLRRPGSDKPARPEDTQALAGDILKSAGFDPKALATVAPLLAEASRHDTVAGQMGVRGRKPQWSP